ncbi:MAG TPA: aspartate ammonia-lyase [Desulfomicrobiaceae bacterium]|nr:aspartate ammonia-lyase [Desulfomicrobiaceae bacterium]
MQYRVEQDSLGKRKVPADAYYGVQTVRAMENFQVTGIPVSHYSKHIQALACIKKAAALVNMELGVLDPAIGQAIMEACREVRSGRLDEQFTVDVIQGGAGTSVNMNANEVIANRGLEILGHAKGEYDFCHPNNHVNLSQSTNDVYPTSLRLTGIWTGQDLVRELRSVQAAFQAKGEEFGDVIKMGRTQLQDAVPMTLGQEFVAYGVTIGEDIQRLREVSRLLHEINMGGTAIGTGINTRPEYAQMVCDRLADITGLPLVKSPDLVEAGSDTGVFVQLSGVLKRIAVKLSKICNDLRLLSSGPFAGLNEINLPPMQPGSSIMPGKVNPVIPEMVNQVCFQVIGNDMTVTMGAEAGQLELNVFEPIIAFNIFQSMDMLTRAAAIFRDKCLTGITANRDRCVELVRCSAGIVTILVPYLGYDEASSIAKEAQCSGRSVYDLVLKKGLMTADQLNDILDPGKMTCPRMVQGEDTCGLK